MASRFSDDDICHMPRLFAPPYFLVLAACLLTTRKSTACVCPYSLAQMSGVLPVGSRAFAAAGSRSQRTFRVSRSPRAAAPPAELPGGTSGEALLLLVAMADALHRRGRDLMGASSSGATRMAFNGLNSIAALAAVVPLYPAVPRNGSGDLIGLVRAACPIDQACALMHLPSVGLSLLGFRVSTFECPISSLGFLYRALMSYSSIVRTAIITRFLVPY